MITIEGHHLKSNFTIDELDDRIAFVDQTLPHRLSEAPAREGRLFRGAIIDACWFYFAGNAQLARRFMGIGVDCAIAMFAAGVADETAVFELEGTPMSGPAGRPDYNANEAFWIDAFLLAVALGRHDEIGPLLAYPTDRLRESPGEGDEFRFAMVDTLKAFWTDNEAWRPLSKQALAESEPDRLTVMSPKMAAPYRCVLAALDPIAAADQTTFTGALADVVRAHKAYYGRGAPSRGCKSLISIPACGTAALGIRRGLRIEASSPYMPAWLTGAP